jgi:hypothetical protein
MRLSELSWAGGELPADGLAVGDRGSPVTAWADQPDLAARPGPDWPGRDQHHGSRSLAERLARLADAHPSAWSGAPRSAAERSSTDWAGARTSGEPPSEHTWWRGESDIWWRIPDRAAGEADRDDDTGGLDDPGELADSDDLGDADGPAEADWAADADDTGEAGDQGGGTGGRGVRRAGAAPGSARPDHSTRDGRWGSAGLARPDQSGPDRGPYRPWFSADVPGDPWFAAGPERWVDSS